jgi:hypothetical protein
VVADGVTQVVNDLIVTTVLYHCLKEQKSVRLDLGASIRRQRGGPWLVLHHIPPIRYPRSGKEETEAAELLQIYRPEYFISGHSHQFPYFPSSKLGANRQRSECACAGTAFDRANPEPYRFQYGVRRSKLGNVESGMDS